MGSCPDTDIDTNTVYWKMSKVKRCEQYIRRKKLYTNSILRSMAYTYVQTRREEIQYKSSFLSTYSVMWAF